MAEPTRTNIQIAGAVAMAAALLLLIAGAAVGALLLAIVAAGLFWATTMGAERN